MLNLFNKKSNGFNYNDIFAECKLLSQKRMEYVNAITEDYKLLRYIDTNPDLMYRAEIDSYIELISKPNMGDKVILSLKDLYHIASKYNMDVINECFLLDNTIVTDDIRIKFNKEIPIEYQIITNLEYGYMYDCYPSTIKKRNLIFERWLKTIETPTQFINVWALMQYIFPLDIKYKFGNDVIGNYEIASKTTYKTGISVLVPSFMIENNQENFGTGKKYINKKYIDFTYPILIKRYGNGISQIIY